MLFYPSRGECSGRTAPRSAGGEGCPRGARSEPIRPRAFSPACVGPRSASTTASAALASCP